MSSFNGGYYFTITFIIIITFLEIHTWDMGRRDEEEEEECVSETIIAFVHPRRGLN